MTYFAGSIPEDDLKVTKEKLMKEFEGYSQAPMIIEEAVNQTKKAERERFLKLINELKIRIKREAKKTDLNPYKNTKEIFDMDTKCFLEYLDYLNEEVEK